MWGVTLSHVCPESSAKLMVVLFACHLTQIIYALSASRPASCHSFRMRFKQLPHPKSDLRVRKSEKIDPIPTSFIYVIIAAFSNLTRLPRLMLAGVSTSKKRGLLQGTDGGTVDHSRSTLYDWVSGDEKEWMMDRWIEWNEWKKFRQQPYGNMVVVNLESLFWLTRGQNTQDCLNFRCTKFHFILLPKNYTADRLLRFH